MTTLSHVDSAFTNVVALEAVNEELMDANLTPDYGTFLKNFVKVVRATELLLGIPTPGFPSLPVTASTNFTALLPHVPDSSLFNAEVRSVLLETVGVLLKMGVVGLPRNREPLITTYVQLNEPHMYRI
jgi:hypothetical protein